MGDIDKSLRSESLVKNAPKSVLDEAKPMYETLSTFCVALAKASVHP
jgi:hypothetical protein